MYEVIGSADGFFLCVKILAEWHKKTEVKKPMSNQMDKLLAAREKTQEKLRRAQEEEKQIRKRIAELQRNERTHRLCNRGSYLEKLLDELGAPDLSDEEVFEHLKYALNTPYAKKHLENLMDTKREKTAAAGENEAAESAD